MKDTNKLPTKPKDNSVKFLYEVLVPDTFGLVIVIIAGFAGLTLLFSTFG